MAWVEIVTVLAVLQFVAFGFLVGRARVVHKIEAPATTGHPQFERYFRVHENTLETLAFLLPSMWIAAHYWAPQWMAAIGAIYLVGRQVYLRSYVANPKSRSAGYGLSFLPAAILALAALAGSIRSLIA